MANDNRELPQDKPNARAAKREIDLFPPLIDRRPNVPGVVKREIPARIGTQISMFSPNCFEEALDIVECLRGRAAITICLDRMKKADANRLVDFVAGASAAIDGDSHKLSEQVFLFCPSNIKISAAGRSEGGEFGPSPLDHVYSDGSLVDRLSFGHLWTKG